MTSYFDEFVFSLLKEYQENLLDIPLPPHEVSIPDGMIRKFHVVGSYDDIDSIKKTGLLMSKAKAVEGPKGIYGWDNWNSAYEYSGGESPIVEYYISKKERENHPHVTLRDIPINDIIAIHEPWHFIYRDAIEDGVTAQELSNIDSEDYQKAARALLNKKENLMNEESLHDWFSHKSGGKPGWVDCKTKKPCGRQKGEKRKSYPACRPTLSQCNSSMRKKKSSKRISWKSKGKK